MNRHLPTLIFSHGNSFPASTYKVLFTELRRRGFKVKALEKLGHDPRYPVSNNWPHLVQELADFASQEFDKSEGPVFLVGHSLGGFLSLMTAARHPHLAHGVLLLDSPVLGGWRATTVGVAKTTQLIGNVSPGAISRLRRTSWASQAEALAHFQSKKIFARWAPEVLHDYVAHGTHDDEHGRRVLSFNREIETALYNTVPDNMASLLKRHPLKCPAAYMGGLHSLEMRQVGMALTQKVTKGRITMLDGSHLFPMEQPLATAAAMEAALLNLHQVRLHGKH
jgi:pimeloyl-ACP methyl ester carboxylesterase